MVLAFAADRASGGAVSPARTRTPRRNPPIVQIDAAVEADAARTAQCAAERSTGAAQSAAKATAQAAAAT